MARYPLEFGWHTDPESNASEYADRHAVAGSHGASITCLAIAIDGERFARDRLRTNSTSPSIEEPGLEPKYGLGGTINSVEPLPPNIHRTLIGLDRRYHAGGEAKLTKEEKQALVFIYDFYDAHPI